jgi:hypothetical protein
MRHTVISLFLCAFALIQGFKLGEDSGYGSFGFDSYSTFKFNPNYIGAFPQQRGFTFKQKYTPSFVETFLPTRNNVLLTDPGRDPLMGGLATGFWQAGVSVVVAVGPLAQTSVKEGDLVYTYSDCPIASRVWLNKPAGDQGDMVCKATPYGIAMFLNAPHPITRADALCQRYSCSVLMSDKCQWTTRTPASDRANYCLVTLPQIRGIVNPPTMGVTPSEVSRITRPRDKWMSWRREDLNKYYSNSL